MAPAPGWLPRPGTVAFVIHTKSGISWKGLGITLVSCLSVKHRYTSFFLTAGQTGPVQFFLGDSKPER